MRSVEAAAARAPAGTAPPADAAPAEPLEWTYQPWRERPGRAALAAVGAFGVCVLILRLGLAPFTAALLCIVTVSLIAPTFVPARCRVDAAGVAVRGPAGWTRRAWTDIRRARSGPHGLLVSPFSRRHWLDPYRSLFLPFPAAESAALGRALSARLAGHDLQT
jgi:hypothetical protein